MGIHGGDTGQARDVDNILNCIYTSIGRLQDNYIPSARQPIAELDSSGGDLITLLNDSGLDYLHDMSGGNLTKNARQGLREMAKNPKYLTDVSEDRKAFETLAEAGSVDEMLKILNPIRLALIVAYEQDEKRRRIA